MSTENPWKTLSTKVVYKNPWITVREDDVITPSGEKGIYGVVESRIATGIVALTENSEIVLVGQFRYAMNEYSWEIIEGGAEQGEDPQTAAVRELAEEAGLIPAHVEVLGDEIHLSNCHSSERAYLYFAKGLTKTNTNPDSTEQLQIKTVSIKTALEMLEKGEIKDSLSIIAIYRIAIKLGIIGNLSSTSLNSNT